MQLVAGLESKGLTAWISPRDLRLGAEYPEEIIRGINSSKCFVLLLSDAANMSDHVRREVERAASKSKPIYPVRIADVAPSPKLEYFISMHHWMDALDGIVEAHLEQLIAAISAGDEWVQGHVAKPKVEDPFSVALQHTGPILPPPSPDEVWRDTYGESERKYIAELKIDSKGIWGKTCTKIAWANEGEVVFGGNEAIFRIDADSGSSSKIFSAPTWRGRFISDFCVSAKTKYLVICGNTFTRTKRVVSTGSGYNGYVREKDFYWHSDWNRILVSPKGDRIVHTGWRMGLRSKNFLKRFFAIPDHHKKYGNTHHYDIHEYPTRLNDSTVPQPVALTGDPVGSLGPGMKLSWSPSGKYISIYPRGLRGGYVTVFDPYTVSDPMVFRDLLPLSHPDRVIGCLAWHPNRDIYVCGYWSKNETPQHGFIIVDAKTRQVIHERSLDRSGETASLDWSPDGRFLALGGEDNAVFLWDFSRDTSVTILGHRNCVTDVFFSPDGRRLLSSAGSEMMVCDPLNPDAVIAKFEGELGQGLRGLPWSPSGKKIMMFSEGGVRVVELQ